MYVATLLSSAKVTTFLMKCLFALTTLTLDKAIELVVSAARERRLLGRSMRLTMLGLLINA